MNVLYFGSALFAVDPLVAICKSRHNVVGVVTRTDKRKGRNLVSSETPIKKKAAELNIPVMQPANVNDEGFMAQAKSAGADIFVVVAFGDIMKRPILDMPPKGCVNLHGSLLPKYRGAAPINRAIVNGDRKTGVTVIRMNERMDAGDMIAHKECPIAAHDTAIAIAEKLSGIGARLMVSVLDSIEDGRAEYIPQNKDEATYAPKLTKNDGLIDWKDDGVNIYNRIRGFVPWPGTYTNLGKSVLKIIEAEEAGVEGVPPGRPGQIMSVDPKAGILVRTGDGAMLLKSVQPEGKRAMSSQEFVRGHKIEPGMMFE